MGLTIRAFVVVVDDDDDFDDFDGFGVIADVVDVTSSDVSLTS